MSIPTPLIPACLCLVVLTMPPAPVTAQNRHEPVVEEIGIAFDSSIASIGGLTQVVADVGFGGSERQDINGFRLAAARLRLYGDLDRGFSYFSQFDFSGSPAVLDARIRFEASPALRIDAGRFKVPFSAEHLISASATDFVNRAQVARSIERGRQVGVAIGGAIPSTVLGYTIGLFTGNGRGDDGRSRLYAGRLTLTPLLASGNLEIGGMIVYSDDSGATGTLAGGDVRFSNDRILLSAEIVRAYRDPESRNDSVYTSYHVTGGFMLEPHRHQILARWDGLLNKDSGSRHFIILGYNTWPARAIRIQINYMIPARNTKPDTHRVLLKLQVAF